MLTHDIIKIKYTREGYLPDYPYHMISDEEMFDAFIYSETDNFFNDNYPCLYESFEDRYKTLVDSIKYHIEKYMNNNNYEIPSWVYSYMLGTTISDTSDQLDRHDLLVMLNMDNPEDAFNEDICNKIYEISQAWVSKLVSADAAYRPPTMYGEPHIIKSLRLEA